MLSATAALASPVAGNRRFAAGAPFAAARLLLAAAVTYLVTVDVVLLAGPVLQYASPALDEAARDQARIALIRSARRPALQTRKTGN